MKYFISITTYQTDFLSVNMTLKSVTHILKHYT